MDKILINLSTVIKIIFQLKLHPANVGVAREEDELKSIYIALNDTTLITATPYYIRVALPEHAAAIIHTDEYELDRIIAMLLKLLS